MKALLSLLLSFPLVGFAQTQTFLQPLTPERAVSDVVRTGAAGRQFDPRVATNGDIALVVWADMREGNWAIYGSRVDPGGNVLDPLGVRIVDGFYLDAVAWNGESFVVVVLTTVAFVSPDLTTITIRQLDLPRNTYRFVAMTTGTDVRFLFMAFSSGNAAIVNSHGDVIDRTVIWTVPGFGWVGGANETSFLLIRNESPGGGAPSRTLSYRIDRDGNVLSSGDSRLPIDLITTGESIAGGADGFLMIRTEGADTIRPVVAIYRLDLAGVFMSSGELARGGSYSWCLVVREESGYLVVWLANTLTGNTQEFAANVGLDNVVTVRTERVLPSVTGLAVASSRGRPFVTVSARNAGAAADEDIFVQVLPETLQLGQPHLVSISGTLQTYVGVAAGANGYALTWVEDGPDSLAHTYVRRFSESGTPQGEAPLPLFTGPRALDLSGMQATIVSNTETYLLGWRTAAGFVIRRLEARSGRWIDPEPIPLGMSGRVALASNGNDAVAFGLDGRCGNTSCLATRRIALTGAPLLAPLVTIRTLNVQLFVGDGVVGSDGTDYLAVWTEATGCPFECGVWASRIYATRLRSDGTTLEQQPLQLTADYIYASNLTIASSGGRYLVAWADPNGAHGVRITGDGSVLDRSEAGGVLLAAAIGNGNESMTSVAAAVGEHFVLLLRHYVYDSASGLSWTTLDGVVFAASTDLYAVATLPRTLLLAKEKNFRRTLAAATHGSTLGIAYDRLGGPDAGGVPRAFLRLFAEPNLRRRAAGH